MRSIAELITEIRHNTNNTQDSRHSDAMMLNFLNTAQRQIQRLIFTSNPTSPLFTRDSFLSYSIGNVKYSLPSDLYARGAILGVYPVRGDGRESEPIQKITEREQIIKAGYYVKDKYIYLSAGAVGESVAQIRISYIRRLPTFTSTSDIPELPEEVEDFLTSFVQRKISAIDSSEDVINFNIFTNTEKSELSELFSDTSKDIKYPIVSDETYITY